MLDAGQMRGPGRRSAARSARTASTTRSSTAGRRPRTRRSGSSKDVLEQLLGQPGPVFAYPHGYHGPRVKRLVAAPATPSASAVRNALSPVTTTPSGWPGSPSCPTSTPTDRADRCSAAACPRPAAGRSCARRSGGRLRRARRRRSARGSRRMSRPGDAGDHPGAARRSGGPCSPATRRAARARACMGRRDLRDRPVRRREPPLRRRRRAAASCCPWSAAPARRRSVAGGSPIPPSWGMGGLVGAGLDAAVLRARRWHDLGRPGLQRFGVRPDPPAAPSSGREAVDAPTLAVTRSPAGPT